MQSEISRTLSSRNDVESVSDSLYIVLHDANVKYVIAVKCVVNGFRVYVKFMGNLVHLSECTCGVMVIVKKVSYFSP